MNQIKLLITLLILSSLLLTSCLKDVDISAENSVQQLVVIAELEEGVQPVMRISTTFSVNSEPQIINGDTAQVRLTESVSNYEDPRDFRPISNDPSVYFLPSDLLPEEGESYKLTIEVPNLDILPIYGETRMPLRGSIDNFNDVSLLSENNDFTELSVSLNMGETPDSLAYYHLIPYIVDNDGTKVYPDISRINTGENGATILTHRDGILIDINNLDNTNLLEFHLRSLLPLDINQLTDKNLYFKLNTVAEEYFLYYKSVSRQFETNQSPFTIPTLSYSQFDNGYGIFTAFSSEIFEYPIN